MKHYNPTIAEDASRIFATKTMDTVGSEVLPYITPTIEVLRYANSITALTVSNSTGATIITTPADKDFYITNIWLSMIKDATATSVLTSVFATINGVSTRLAHFAGLTLTANAQNATIEFAIPVKVDRGTTITLNNTTAVGNITAIATIYAYTVETTR